MVSLYLVVCENLARGQGEGSDLTVDNRSSRNGESGQSSSQFGPRDCTEVSFCQHLKGAEIARSTTGYALSSVLAEGLFVDFVSHELNNVWGVGRQLTKFYIKNGINTAYELKNMHNGWIKKNTSVFGSRTAMELRGIPCISLDPHQDKRKNCCVSRSFGRRVESLNKLKESITTHCLNAAEKIRNDEQTTKSITVYIRTSPFDKNRKYYSNSITIDLPVSTNNSLELVKTAINGLTKIYKYGYFYQKAGIILSKLREASENEFNLLAPIMEKKSKTLMQAIDLTNAKYGRNAISIAQAGINNDWKMRREHSSKIDTASFDFLPEISV